MLAGIRTVAKSSGESTSASDYCNRCRKNTSPVDALEVTAFLGKLNDCGQQLYAKIRLIGVAQGTEVARIDEL
jgi:hypothetical protein